MQCVKVQIKQSVIDSALCFQIEAREIERGRIAPKKRARSGLKNGALGPAGRVLVDCCEAPDVNQVQAALHLHCVAQLALAKQRFFPVLRIRIRDPAPF
jgi:hypothetical protein